MEEWGSCTWGDLSGPLFECFLTFCYDYSLPSTPRTLKAKKSKGRHQTLGSMVLMKRGCLWFGHHTIHAWKCTIQWLLGCSQSNVTITTVSFRTFLSSPKRNPVPIRYHPPPCNHPLSHGQPLIYFLCRWVYLFWTFHINWISCLLQLTSFI